MRSTALSALLCVLLLPLALRAQMPLPEMGIAFGATNVEFLSSPMTFEFEAVPNSPYSAEAVTEMVQTLADGNRIVRETKALVSRDGQGRMRREQGFPMLGGVAGAGASVEIHHVQISDPAAGTTIMLDYENKIARKIVAPPKHVLTSGGVNTVQMNHFELAVPPPPPPGPNAPGVAGPMMVGGGVRMFARNVVRAELQPVVEQLGTQVVQGVVAEGTRSTATIPAGQVGNERPIQIVSERWYSSDLKTLVMSRHSDPRFGETTYRLANLTLGEPPADQFEVPADFRVIEAQ